jgi:HD superfamily phosphodiesterase
MHTKTAKKIAKRRTDFLIDFLKEFKLELEGK